MSDVLDCGFALIKKQDINNQRNIKKLDNAPLAILCSFQRPIANSDICTKIKRQSYNISQISQKELLTIPLISATPVKLIKTMQRPQSAICFDIKRNDSMSPNRKSNMFSRQKMYTELNLNVKNSIKLSTKTRQIISDFNSQNSPEFHKSYAKSNKNTPRRNSINPEFSEKIVDSEKNLFKNMFNEHREKTAARKRRILEKHMKSREKLIDKIDGPLRAVERRYSEQRDNLRKTKIDPEKLSKYQKNMEAHYEVNRAFGNYAIECKNILGYETTQNIEKAKMQKNEIKLFTQKIIEDEKNQAKDNIEDLGDIVKNNMNDIIANNDNMTELLEKDKIDPLTLEFFSIIKKGDFHGVKIMLINCPSLVNSKNQVFLLYLHKSKIKMTPLHYASKYGHYDIVKYLLKMGANPNSIDIVYFL